MYGETIKKIRKDKGYTQKEVYTGVVSKTFYSDFEAGKYSIEITKFQGVINNLGISYEEFEYFRNHDIVNEANALENQVDTLYKKGKFEELYALYEQYHRHPHTEIRYVAMNAYLLVLITNTNYYKLSREPFNEITTELETLKMWTLREIKLSKLVLLSISEKDKDEAEKVYNRILSELKKYEKFNRPLYDEEVGDLHFNRIQSLLMMNDMRRVEAALSCYNNLLAESDNLHLIVQLTFINNLVALYVDFFNAQTKMSELVDNLSVIPVSETKFYTIIFQLHQEKARNYYMRNRKKKGGMQNESK